MHLTDEEVGRLLVSVLDRMIEHLFYYEQDREFFGPLSEIDGAYKQGYLQGMSETVEQLRNISRPRFVETEIPSHNHNST